MNLNLMQIRYFLIFVISMTVAFALAFAVSEATIGDGPLDSSAKATGQLNEIAFVANAVEGTVSLIDIKSKKVVGSINVIPDGKQVGLFRDIVQWIAQPIAEGKGGLNFAQDTDLSRDGRVLFVSRGFLGDVAAFDISSGRLLWRSPIAGIRADHMAISPDGKRLFVSAVIRGGNVVEILDTYDGSKQGEIQAGQWPHDVHVTNDGRRVYIASLGDMELPVEERRKEQDAYKITVANAKNGKVLREYHFDSGIRPFQVVADETRLFAQLSNTHSVVSLNLKTDEQDGQIDLPIAPGTTPDDWDFEAPHHGLALSPDESTLCVAGRASDYAGLLNAEDLKLVATIPTGNAPSWSVFDRAGSLCLLANTRSDNVSIVDVASQKEIARISVGRGAKHITVGMVPTEIIEH